MEHLKLVTWCCFRNGRWSLVYYKTVSPLSIKLLLIINGASVFGMGVGAFKIIGYSLSGRKVG